MLVIKIQFFNVCSQCITSVMLVLIHCLFNVLLDLVLVKRFDMLLLKTRYKIKFIIIFITQLCGLLYSDWSIAPFSVMLFPDNNW